MAGEGVNHISPIRQAAWLNSPPSSSGLSLFTFSQTATASQNLLSFLQLTPMLMREFRQSDPTSFCCCSCWLTTIEQCLMDCQQLPMMRQRLPRLQWLIGSSWQIESALLQLFLAQLNFPRYLQQAPILQCALKWFQSQIVAFRYVQRAYRYLLSCCCYLALAKYVSAFSLFEVLALPMFCDRSCRD